MPTSLLDFRCMPHRQKRQVLAAEGVLLLTWPDDEGELRLYHLRGGFFAEAFLYNGTEASMSIHSNCFTGTERLGRWAGLIEFPAGMV